MYYLIFLLWVCSTLKPSTMFKKPYTSKPQTTLKNSDRKRLRLRVQQQFNLSEDLSNLLLPQGTTVAKVKTHVNDQCLLYKSPNNNPIWFSDDKGNNDSLLIPTVYTLFLHPTLLPVVTTWKFVIDKLTNGADLMSPGLSLKSKPDLLPNVQKNSLVAIAEHGQNLAPIGVGITATDISKINLESSGKAVFIKHCINDTLYLSGDQPSTIPNGNRNDLQLSDYESEDEDLDERKGEDDKNVDNKDINEKFDDLKVDERDHQQRSLTVDEVDEILKFALVHSITTTLKNVDLPIQSSTLLSAHVLPNRTSRIEPSLTDLKASSYKKANKYLKAMEKEELITIKEQKSNVLITSINIQHPLVKTWKGHKSLQAAEKQVEKKVRQQQQQEQNERNQGFDVEEVYLAPSNSELRDWFDTMNVKNDDYYTSLELRDLINIFIESNNLIHPSDHGYVLGKENEEFSKVIYPKPKQNSSKKQQRLNSQIEYDDSDYIPRSELIGRLLINMHTFTRISKSNHILHLVKGQLQHFKLQIKQRQGRKVTTHLSGPFNYFDLKIDILTTELKTICASSTTYGPIQSNPKETEVVVQGDKIKVIIDVLSNKCGIPKRLIDIVPKK